MTTFFKIAKIGHHPKAIALAKSSLWVKNENSQKHDKNNSRSTFKLLCAKNCSKKHQTLQKSQLFKNRQNLPRCKCYITVENRHFG